MKAKLIDTNILIRFLVEDDSTEKYRKVFELFEKLEKKEETVFLDNLVVIEAYFVLTKYYEIPYKVVIDSLKNIILFSGIEMDNKLLIISAFERMLAKKIDFTDSYIIELSLLKGTSIYTNDKDIKKNHL